jgi:hypothetical protein
MQLTLTKPSFLKDFILQTKPELNPLGDSGLPNDPYGMTAYLSDCLEAHGNFKTILPNKNSLTLNDEKRDGTYKDPLNPEIKFSGNWQNYISTSLGLFPKDLCIFSNQTSSYIEFTFYGKNIYANILGNPNMTTTLQVNIDGVAQAALDLSSAVLTNSIAIFKKLNSSTLSPGIHHIKLQLNENKYFFITGFTIETNTDGTLDVDAGDAFINGYKVNNPSQQVLTPSAISTNLGRADTISISSTGAIVKTEGIPHTSGSELYGSDTDHSDEEVVEIVPISEFIGQNGTGFIWKPYFSKKLGQWVYFWSDKNLTNNDTTGWGYSTGWSNARVTLFMNPSGGMSTDVNLYAILPQGISGCDLVAGGDPNAVNACSLYVDNITTPKKTNISLVTPIANTYYNVPLMSQNQTGSKPIRLLIPKDVSGTYVYFNLISIKLYAPKRAALPANSVRSADSIQLNSYTANPNSPIDTGVKFVHAIHSGKFINGTTGVWSLLNGSDYLGNTTIYTSTPITSGQTDTYCEMEFVGTGFEILAYMSNAQGIQDILLDAGAGYLTLTTTNFPTATIDKDGVVYDDVNGRADCYVASPLYNQRMVRCINLPYSSYKVKVRTSGTKNGSSSNYYAHITGLAVIGQKNLQIDERSFDPLGKDPDTELLKVQKQDKDSALQTVIDESIMENGTWIGGGCKPMDNSAGSRNLDYNVPFLTTKKLIPILIISEAVLKLGTGNVAANRTTYAVTVSVKGFRIQMGTTDIVNADTYGLYDSINWLAIC